MCFEQRAVLLQNLNKDVCLNSTSGGAFTEIARYTLAQGGIVYGAIIDENFIVKHISIDTEELLYKFRNSKYVQSELGDTFVNVKRDLQTNKLVCFSGTPCQIAGLKAFLLREYDNLILVDVVCRAVPSPGVWKKYISMEQEKLGRINSIRFRDKTLGYQYSTMEIRAINGRISRGGIESQPWLRMFFSGMIIRPSCTECRFRDKKRVSDLTIWDCFNVYMFDRSFNERIGTTRMLIHSSKGNAVFEEIKEKFHYKEISPDEATVGVKEMIISPNINRKRVEFYNDYDRLSMTELIDKYFPIGLKQKAKQNIRLVLNKTGLDIPIRHLLKKGQ